jgi:hypothetical protein
MPSTGTKRSWPPSWSTRRRREPSGTRTATVTGGSRTGPNLAGMARRTYPVVFLGEQLLDRGLVRLLYSPEPGRVVTAWQLPGPDRVPGDDPQLIDYIGRIYGRHGPAPAGSDLPD